MSGKTPQKVDFYLSYAREDLAWAEWIAWELEEAGYSTVVEAWDFRPGENLIHRIERTLEQADRTIALLTPAYLESAQTKGELSASMLYWGQPRRKLLPIMIKPCIPSRLLATEIYVDLIDISEAVARDRLLQSVRGGRAKPTRRPGFPGEGRSNNNPPIFPGEQRRGEERRLPRAADAVLAVLPFGHHDGGFVDAYLVSGFCDEIVTTLTKLNQIVVVAPSSTMNLLGSGRSPTEVGREFGATAVLTGSLREYEELLRLHVSLVDTNVAHTLWAERFEFPRENLAATQASVALSVAEALKIQMTGHERNRLSEEATDTVKAYELYLRGSGTLASNEERETDVALGMLDEALRLDLGFAQAHAARGYALWRKYFSGWDADIRTLRLAQESARTALAIDPTCSAAMMTLVRTCWDFGQHQEALDIAVSATQSNPGSMEPVLALARACNNAGMAELALPLTHKILRTDKANPAASKLLIWNQLMVGDYHASVRAAAPYIRRHPGDSNTRWAVAVAELLCGRGGRAVTVAREGLARSPSDVTLWVLLGYLHRTLGDESSARQAWLEGIDSVSPRLVSFEENWRMQIWYANLEAAFDRTVESDMRCEAVIGAEPATPIYCIALRTATPSWGHWKRRSNFSAEQ
jgi:TolB-like protein